MRRNSTYYDLMTVSLGDPEFLFCLSHCLVSEGLQKKSTGRLHEQMNFSLPKFKFKLSSI